MAEEKTLSDVLSTKEEKSARKQKEDSVVMSKEEYDNIQKSIAELTKAVRDTKGEEAIPSPLLKRPDSYTARLRVKDGEYVIGLVCTEDGNTKFEKEYDARGNEYLFLTLIVLKKNGETEERRVEYVKEFLNKYSSVNVDIVQKKSREVIINHGMTREKVYNYSKYQQEETGNRVPLDVLLHKYVYTVRLPDGREVDIDERFINM